MNETTFENKCAILSQVWLEFRDDENFADFFQYADLGMPLAYLIDNDIVKATADAKNFVDETFELFMGILGIDEDTGFDSLDDMLGLTIEDIEDE